jgi:Uma2 family endonuclease
MTTSAQDRDLPTGLSSIVVHLRPVVDLSDDQLFEFSQINRDLRMERSAQGELIIMPPTGGDAGERNAEVTMQLRIWAKQDGMGATFDSSTGFRLPNGAVRSPDASWMSYDRLNSVTPEQRQKFLPLCPDFVIELRTPTDSLNALHEKMQEYIDNGARLGWLIDPQQKRVAVYQPDHPIQEIEGPDNISGDPVLSGFTLSLREIW